MFEPLIDQTGRPEVKVPKLVKSYGLMSPFEAQDVLKRAHGDKYAFIDVEVQTVGIETPRSRTFIVASCPVHGTFKKISGHLLNQKEGCPQCANSRTSKLENAWLNSLNIPGLKRQYPLRAARQYFVDGYDPATNRVFELHGVYWHGSPKYYHALSVNKRCGKTFGELYQATLQKEADLREAGFNLTVMWEDEWILITTGHLPKQLQRLANKIAMQHL